MQVDEPVQEEVTGSEERLSSGLPEPLWTVEEAARYLKLEPGTVRAMARRGELPAFKVGRVWRFKQSALSSLGGG